MSKQSLALAESPLRHLMSVSSLISHFPTAVGVGPGEAQAQRGKEILSCEG